MILQDYKIDGDFITITKQELEEARDTIVRLTKPQRMVSAEAKENGYGEPDEFGEYINELSKQFPEVSFAKLSRIAVRVKNWLEQQKSK